MPSTRKKRRYHRRNRRLDKQSGYTRLPKTNPKKAGHGGNGTVKLEPTRKIKPNSRANKPEYKPTPECCTDGLVSLKDLLTLCAPQP